MEETMATKANIIKVYAQADSAKKVDIIIRYYPNFMGIVESYTDGLRYMIENEKAFKERIKTTVEGTVYVRKKLSN